MLRIFITIAIILALAVYILRAAKEGAEQNEETKYLATKINTWFLLASLLFSLSIIGALISIVWWKL